MDYVNGFRRRLYVAVKMAKENLEVAQANQKRLYDRKAEQKFGIIMQVGQSVKPPASVPEVGADRANQEVLNVVW